MIRVEAVWLAIDPLDMRSGSEAALARVVHVSLTGVMEPPMFGVMEPVTGG